MQAIYSKDANTIREQTPNLSLLHEWMTEEDTDLEERMEQEREHKKELASLRTIPCSDKCRELWEDGKVLTEGKDYTQFECDYCDGVGSVEGGKALETTCQKCGGLGLICIPISEKAKESAKRVGPWLWVIAQIKSFWVNDNREFGAMGRLIDKLDAQYPLSKIRENDLLSPLEDKKQEYRAQIEKDRWNVENNSKYLNQETIDKYNTALEYLEKADADPKNRLIRLAALLEKTENKGLKPKEDQDELWDNLIEEIDDMWSIAADSLKAKIIEKLKQSFTIKRNK